MYCVVKGPALYAYNNAVFSEDDWKGIRMLLQSVKQDDPHKVGYFGMGFKSVFHVTGIYIYPVHSFRPTELNLPLLSSYRMPQKVSPLSQVQPSLKRQKFV